MNSSADGDRHRHLSAALMRPDCYPHAVSRVVQLETHISRVFLAGDRAYKLKKPLDLGFLNYSQLAQRRHFCLEEWRLNRLLAGDFYIGVQAVMGPLEAPSIKPLEAAGEVLDYVVCMRRFAQQDRLDNVLDRGCLSPALLQRIAAHLIRFHAQAAAAPETSSWGEPAQVVAPMRDNFAAFDHRFAAYDRLQALSDWTETRSSALQERLQQRRQQGHIRECHGDLHLGNMALVEDSLLFFDRIEFDPALRFIDCLNEVAFFCMDLSARAADSQQRLFLDHYLTLGGDYGGLDLFHFYRVYRAMVRAKIAFIRYQQGAGDDSLQQQAMAECKSYLTLAEQDCRRSSGGLLITHGLSGSGKSWLSQQLLAHFPVIRLRSDVERKRLYGDASDNLYDDSTDRRVYQHLADCSARLLAAGFWVLVDAACLHRWQRHLLLEVAAQQRLPCRILDVQTAAADCLARLQQRRDDPSDADEGVLARQQQQRQQLTAEEAAQALVWPGRDSDWSACKAALEQLGIQ